MSIDSSTFFPPSLDPTTIVPTTHELFIPYFNRNYEDIANVVNNKDDKFFKFPITSSAQNIPILGIFGSYIICVSGSESTLPTITASLCKSDSTAAGSVVTLGSQVGTGAWAGNTIIISSSSTNFQIRHDRAGITGNFNIRVIGTQI